MVSESGVAKLQSGHASAVGLYTSNGVGNGIDGEARALDNRANVSGAGDTRGASGLDQTTNAAQTGDIGVIKNNRYL
jgi:hypothetical protein